MDKSNTKMAIENLKHALSVLQPYFDNPSVQEIMVNGPGDVWVEEKGRINKLEVSLSETSIRSAIQILARLSGKEASASSADAIIDARMEGYRIAAAMMPISTSGSSISIRKHSKVVKELVEYVTDGAVPLEVHDLLVKAVIDRKNILISGGTSSGKTTFLNALAKKIPHSERVLTIEDTKELQILAPNSISFESNVRQGISIRDLVKLALRYRPDRIIVGEVRGPEAFDLMQAMNTGHDGGFATLHANSSHAALRRLESLVLTTPDVDWGMDAIRSQIGMTFDYVIHLARDAEGRRGVKEVLQLHDFNYERKDYDFELVYKNASVAH